MIGMIAADQGLFLWYCLSLKYGPVIPGRGHSPRARNQWTQAAEVLGSIGVRGFRVPSCGRPRN